MKNLTRRICDSRKNLVPADALVRKKTTEEGGCGVVGFAASVPVSGRHIFEPSIQMHNRGNGKGGGIAAACLVPEQLGVDQATLRDDYLLQIALLDHEAQKDVEAAFIASKLEIHHKSRIEPAADFRDLGLDVQPPDVVRYFVRVKTDALDEFAAKNSLSDAAPRSLEDEFIYQNSTRLNQRFYTSYGKQQAFVLSHARNLILFKIVGYAENVVQYYGLNDLKAGIWIAHQRYPTKGRVWHPAGSHPFIGMNEALVHNGDFANYYAVSEYLRQHNIVSQFLTDTEVSVLLFDLWHRVYRYPLEYVIEALAPTTELDFDSLPEKKQRIYRALQSLHMHGSPDGPWFFIIARSNPDDDAFQLLGITDTAMLRPQVFAIQEGDVSIGLVASEKQAIDATLHSLNQEDPRFRLVADRYWNARGGSHTDGGAFAFTLKGQSGEYVLSCTDKFGKQIVSPEGEWQITPAAKAIAFDSGKKIIAQVQSDLAAGDQKAAFCHICEALPHWNLARLSWITDQICQMAQSDPKIIEGGLTLLTELNDRRYNCGGVRRSSLLQIVRTSIDKILDSVPTIDNATQSEFKRITWETRQHLRPPKTGETVLVINAKGFAPEGADCDARLAVAAYRMGWKKFVVYALSGQRFHGCGLGPHTKDVRFDIYGSSGDYLASGIDGLEIRVHDNGQDQLGQIMKNGRLVVYGDVGQTFMYGGKGGEVYIMGNAAGRPLINAVGSPRVIINGTSLDYLAESFMAGNPLKGGGFVVLNGITFNDKGAVVDLPTPYPGVNLFSLASGGAIYLRDPFGKVIADQLNGGEIVDLSPADWELILPYLMENESLFGISVNDDLLTVNGAKRDYLEVYRKVQASQLDVLAKASQAVAEWT
jgi:glutamate synthase domain-containing protein 1/glutamate synthase domain-containing protein 3